MADEIEIGAILQGNVTKITKFGAFVSLPGGRSGLVHISEIAYSYVNEVSDYLSEGQQVTVKVIAVDENGRINLSVKQALPAPSGRSRSRGNPGGGSAKERNASSSRSSELKEATFDDMLRQFMSDSDSKLSGRYSDKTSRRRGTRRN